MHNNNLKALCSVIENGYHYKGNIISLNGNQIIIKGIYPCEIAIQSIKKYSLKHRFFYLDIHMIIDDSTNKNEELIIRMPKSNKAKLIAEYINRTSTWNGSVH